MYSLRSMCLVARLAPQWSKERGIIIIDMFPKVLGQCVWCLVCLVWFDSGIKNKE